MPLITLNANFNVENAQKKVQKNWKNTKNTILFHWIKNFKLTPLAYFPVLRLYFFLGYFELLALIPIFGIVFVGGRLGGECFHLFQWCRDRCLEKRNLFSFFFSPVPERTDSPVCAWKYSYYYVNEMLYKSMSENNDNSEIFKLSVFFLLFFFHLPWINVVACCRICLNRRWRL